jgi:hypothetical protein
VARLSNCLDSEKLAVASRTTREYFAVCSATTDGFNVFRPSGDFIKSVDQRCLFYGSVWYKTSNPLG